MAETDYSIPLAQRFTEGISIIYAAQPGADFAAEHDIFYFGSPDGLSEEARARLDVLGWFVSDDSMAFFT